MLKLTRREKQVLWLFAEGHTTKEVAAKLGISLSCTKTHRANIMRKRGRKPFTSNIILLLRDHFHFVPKDPTMREVFEKAIL